ncbi:MAG: RnfABCDGE type electron transport complex subunit D [Candidatus Omnitrophica bacterium]|nr:RnfABCDGE type electron transport complex subunit D [Candidatus Omnitrophota bacterium]
MLNFKSVKTQFILYLACFAVFLSIKDKDSAFLLMTMVALVLSVAIESLIVYWKTKTLEITESSMITGLIIGFVLSSGEPWWKFVAASALAIGSKQFIRFKKKHLFNPAAFGLFLTLILLAASSQWKGTYVWYITVPAGIYFAYKFKKLEVLLGYGIVAIVLFGTQALLQKVLFWNIFGYFSYFYIFVMAIEPKTTPIKPVGKYVFGSGVAMLIFILTQIGVSFDVELLSLLAMNTAVPFLNNVSLKKEK